MSLTKLVAISVIALTSFGCLENQKVTKETKTTTIESEKNNHFWWPEKINLSPLRQHAKESSPMAASFNYKKEFNSLNLSALKKDIEVVLKTSQEWWPADWGHYGPFFIRMAWHSAGTYRVSDGRGGAAGGQLRFEPLNSWPDNANLDKARRLLWPIKKKYGKKISWADLMVLAGNVSLESMGFKTFGFSGGRTDDFEPDLVYWGPETKFLESNRRTKKGKLKKPFGASQMALIYVNPVGPDGKPDPLLAAKAIREAFGRMAMNDEETVALIAGGHTFGKAHGAKKPEDCVGPEPAAAGIEEQGMGWKNKCGTGKGKDTITSGLEGAWTSTPTQWSMQYLQFLYSFEWKTTKSPAGHIQWIPKDDSAKNLVPDAHVKGKTSAPIMFTTDLALRFDPEYGKITKRFLENPKDFELAFAKAWFKLTHRDLGPRSRYTGSEVPGETLVWQDPIPTRNHALISSADVETLKNTILSSGLTVPQLVRTAWASASSFRGTDMRGGANGARINLAPQNEWPANNPTELKSVLAKLQSITNDFNKSGKTVSLADTIVIAGDLAVEQAAQKSGVSLKINTQLGRMDAQAEQTDVASFSELEPKADGFRNYYNSESYFPPVKALIDKANLLTLTVPEMTVLVGGLRVLGANANSSQHGVFTKNVGTLSNDFFVNLLDMSTRWEKDKSQDGVYNGVDRKSGSKLYTATSVDLIFGSSSELRAIAEVYAADDGKSQFIQDFAKAWKKVMNLDRFDLQK